MEFFQSESLDTTTAIPTRCQKLTSEFFGNKQDLPRATTICCAVNLSFNVCTMCYIFVFIVKLRNKNPTPFTICLVSLVAITIMLGAVEYILVIMALKDENFEVNPLASHFVLDDCYLGISWMSGIQQYMQWLAVMSLAMKYHNTAIQIDSVLKQGTLLQNRKTEIFKIGYICLFMAVLIYTFTQLSLNTYFTHHNMSDQLHKLKKVGNGFQAFWIAVPGISFLISYWHLTQTTSKHSFATRVNLKMMTLNLFFILIVFASQVWYFFSISQVGLDTVLAVGFTNFSRLIVKVILLAFLASFGENLTVKSICLQNGQLMIVGLDQNGEEQFALKIQRQTATLISCNLDDLSDYEEEEVTIYNTDDRR